ncbi:AcrR family transcriptional regulator [Mycolicibacterium sp. BK556]|uniref:TetR/AcrR family transcriptional regulator n=1 Tax=unclassified Mycolicibacterium TaxID=2636767 RepID=UPI0016082068|nr:MULTISPECIES: TetR/AcrR family transcriptional regulator [unclassified Mycolicibacterium]MBB3604384.1 AcrR family transcriptional regulator [Mycolicibacterium sp. BK556]MBB3634903.1 AcrR family transcriptional regulator [Mycolicibacterium sp. BK607]
MTRRRTDAARVESPSAGGTAAIDKLVDAALRAASELGRDVADVPIAAIARHAGISRSTLLRRLGGARASLDDAVRARGVDPGGIAPVRTRALDAAAALIAESGLAAATFEAIADRAECSIPSLYANFGTRDGLLRAMFERHSPLVEMEDFLAGDTQDLRATVRRLYGFMAAVFGREPQVTPAMFADALIRPDTEVARSLATYTVPRVMGVIGEWLAEEVRAGRIRDLPVPLLVHQLLAPMAVHMMLRPIASNVAGVEFPELDTSCDVFTDIFLRGVSTASPS